MFLRLLCVKIVQDYGSEKIEEERALFVLYGSFHFGTF